MIPGRRAQGLVLFCLGLAAGIGGQYLGLLFLPAVLAGCLLMALGGLMFAKSYLDL